MNILLVEPNFPKSGKSKNHNGFMPIGLLKLAAYNRKRGNAISLIRRELPKNEIRFEYPNGRFAKSRIPDYILITSYFTYWSKYVKQSVSHYKKLFPKSKVIVGGVYASLMPEHCKKYTGCDEVFIGVHKEAEKCNISFRYLEKHFGPIDYQIIHTSRGCIRRCSFCGAFKIEPKFTYKSSILKEIEKKKIIFYDNNLLANPYIENILIELGYLKEKGKILWCEAQSGIDGRLIENNHNLAYLLKKAGFKNIRISWDGPLKDATHIKKQIKILENVGYNLKRDVFIFMIYNWDIPFEIMEKKRIKCWEWKVQILDCRYRPLDQTFDNYSGQKFRTGQTKKDYHIHEQGGWTDKKIRTFRKNIRKQNICIRLNIPFYSNSIEKKYLCEDVTKKLIHIARNFPISKIILILNDIKIPYWFPESYNGNGHSVKQEMIYREFDKMTNKHAFWNRKETKQFQKWREETQFQVFNKIFTQ